MKTFLLSNGESTVNNFVDRPSIFNFKPFRFLMMFLMFSLVAQVGFATTVTWTGGTGTDKDWTLASNWGGTAPVAGDDIVFDTAGGGAITFSIMPASIAYNSITVNSGNTITIVATAATTLTLGGNAGTDLTVSSGATLILGNFLNITLAANATATIAGTLTVATGGTYDTGNTSVKTTVNGTITNTGGTITNPNPSKLAFNAGSTYNHQRDGGSIPLASPWATSSTVNVTGITSTALTNFSQAFGDINWNCSGQTVTQLTSTGFAPSGDFSINNTGSGGSITLASNLTVPNLHILTVASGATLIAQATSIISGAGTFTLASGGIIKIASADGISSSGATGNVQTATRIFSTGATYIYNGVSQNTGNGLPSIVSKLNLEGTGTKTFTNGVNVTNGLTINSGVVASLGSNNSTAGTFTVNTTLGGYNGTWGSTASSATNKSALFFGASGTGTLSVSVNTCSGFTSASVIANNTPQCSGSNATFTLNGTADGIVTYTLNGGANTDVTLDGAGAATITVSGATTTQILSLVSAKNAITNCPTSISGTSTVTIYHVPAITPITGQPANQSITYGNNATFTVTATNDHPTAATYQWEEKMGAGSFLPISNGGIYSGATSSTLTLTKPVVSASTRNYRCVITNPCGSSTTDEVASLTVAAKALTITADNKSKAYSAAVPTLTITYSGLVSGELAPATPATVTTTGTMSSAVGTYPITASGAVDPNYTINYTAGVLTVDKVALMITAVNKSKDYGAALPTLTVTYSGLVNGDVAPATLPTIATTATATSPVGTYPITASLAADPNYNISYTAGVLTVDKVALMITAVNKSKDYGAALPTLTVTYSGLVNGDVAPATLPTIATTATATSPVGTYPITASLAADPNYNISYTAGVLTVDKVALMITAVNKSKDYGAALPTLTVTYSGLVNGDVAPATLPTIATTATATSPVGTYPITASLAADPNYNISYTAGVLTVDKVALMITAVNKSKDYGAALPTLTVTYSGLVNGDVAPATLPTIATTATATSPVGTYPITASLAADPNYNISYTAGVLTVDKVALMITAVNKSKDYGAALPTLTVTYSGLVNGDVAPATLPTIATTATATSPVGTYPITASLAADPNYNISYTAGVLTVDKVALMITAVNKSKDYGAALPTLTVTYSGLVNGDVAPATLPTIATTATATSPVGTYPITASLAADPNYNISYTAGVLTVDKVALMITAVNKSKDYGAALPTLTVTYSGLVNGDVAPATLPTIATTATATSPVGTYPITASLAADPNYNISYTAGVLTVDKVALMITAVNKSKDYGAALPTLTVTYSGLVNGDVAPATLPTIATTATATSPVGTYPITASLAADPNYNISYTAGVLTVDKVALMITAVNKSKDYGAALPTLTVTYSGLVNGDVAPATLPTIATTATATSPVGTYPITASLAADPNYNISYTAGVLTVDKVALMITAVNKSKDYGAALPTLTVTYSGLVNGDVAPATLPTIATTATATSPVGTYPITASLAADPNYNISYTAGVLTVDKVALMITAVNKSKDYGAALPTLTVTYSGLVNGDVAPATLPTIATTATATSPVGTYPITASLAADPNYNISYTAGVLTVDKVALMITAVNKSKDYGAALPTLTVTYSGLVNGDVAPATLPTIATTATATSPVGTYPITASLAADPNYNISYTAGVLTVDKVALMITAVNKSKDYGAALPTLTVTYSGLVNGDVAPATLPTIATTATATSPVGTYPITASLAADPNYNISYTAGVLTVDKVALMITAVNKSKDYGAALPTLTVTYSGLVNGDVAPATLPTIATTATATSPVGTYPITASLAADPNYNISYTAGVLTVDKVALMITAVNKSKDYGAALPTLTVTYSGLVNGDVAPATLPTIATTATATSPVGTYPITASLAADPNYNISYTAGVLTVDKVALMITAVNKSKDYGAALPTLTVTYSGLVNGDVAPATLPTIATTATATSPVGTYPITASLAADPNYNISYTAGVLTVDKVALMITAVNKSKDYGAALPTLTVTYSGLVNGDVAPATLPTIATTATATSPVGTYPITASLAADPNYNISYTAGVLTVDKVALMITAVNKSKDYGAALPTLTVTYSGLVNGDVAPATLPTIATTATATSPVGTYPITASLAADPNYNISYTTGVLTVDKVALMITASNRNKCEGTNVIFAGTEFTSVGLVSGDAITSVTLTSTGAASTATKSPNPNYPIIATAALGTGLSNYNITYTNGTLTITSPTLLFVPTPAPCYGDLGGAILQAAGGSGSGYVFASSPSTNVTITGSIMTAPAGVYVITVTDGAGCAKSGTLTISQPTQITGSGAKKSYNGSDLSCATATDGEITVTATGGTGTKEYAIDNGTYQSSNVFSGLAAGVHTLKVKDANGCEVSLPSVTITAPSAVVAGTPSVSSTTNVSCFGGSNGAINISVSATGGTPGVSPNPAYTYTYVWSNGTSIVSSLQNPTGLPAGTYSVLVTAKDANLCSNFKTLTGVVINQPAILAATVTPTPATCFGGMGSIAVTLPTGGAGSYEYSNNNGGTWQTSPSFPSLLAGTYQMSIRDLSVPTCVIDLDGSGGTVVGQPVSLPSASIGGATSVCIGSSAPTIIFAGSGGTGTLTYTYKINSGGNLTTTSNITAPTGTAGTFTYTLLSVTDGNGCVVDYTTGNVATVTVNPLPTAVVSGGGVVCAGATLPNVSIALTGTQPWSVTYTDGTTPTTVTGITASPFVITGATAGTYTVTAVSDANTCVGTSMTGIATVTVNPLPIVGAGANVAICTGASTTLTATGATSYSWNTSPVQTTSAITVSPTTTTTYTVTGTDANGCVNTDAVEVTVNALPIVNAGSDVAICTGASTTLTATGATSYSWNTSPVQTTSAITVSPTATTTYTVTGTDANGCVNTDAVEVTVNALPIVGAGADVAICTGASTTLTATGATSYSWNTSPVQTTSAITVSPTTTTTYTVTGTDANGCVNTDEVEVTVNPLPIVNAGSDVAICTGASTTLTATGATSYSWNTSPVQTTSAITVSPTATTTYTVTGTDANGCVNTDAVEVTVNALPIVNAGSDVAICTGASTTLTATGATSYSWNTSPVQTTSAITVSPTATTTYTVTGTDANGCVNTDAVEVTVNALPIVGAGADVAICTGASTTLTATGATSYSWNTSPVQTTSAITVSPTTTTTYTVTGTDANGCVNTDEVEVTVNPLPTVGAGSDQTVCEGSSVTLSGNGASTYTWSGGITDATPFVATTTTTYTVTGTDINGCTGTDDVTIIVNPKPNGTSTIASAICSGTPLSYALTVNNGVNSTFTWVATTVPSGVTGASITNQIGSSITDNLVYNGMPMSGNANVVYTVTPTSVTGLCIGTSFTVTVPVKPAFSSTINAVPTSICLGASSQLNFGSPILGPTAATVDYTDGTSSTFTATFNAGIAVATVTPNATTTYSLVSMTVNGCTKTLTGSTTVTVNQPPTLTIVNPAAVCSPATVDITSATVQTTNTGTITKYYSTNALAMAGGTEDIATPNAIATSSTVYIRSESSAGCYVIQPVTVVVNPLPTISTTPVTICAGASTTLTASGASTYVWKEGTTILTNLTVSPITTTTYTVEGTDGNSCTNTASLVVTVNPLPTISTNAVTICAGASTILVATGANTYVWKEGTTTLTNLTVSPTTTTTYTVEGTDANGCKNTASLVVTVNQLPTISTTPVTICSGASTTLTATGASFYVWKEGTTTLTNLTVSPTVTTTYSVEGMDANSCKNTATLTVTVNPLPTFTTTFINPSCNGASNGSIEVTTSATSPMFSINGGTYVSGPNPYSFSTLAGGTYSIKVKDANTCESVVSSVTLTQPAVIVVTAIPTAALCFGGNGSAALSATGGNGVYTFTSTGGTVTGSSLSAPAGTYTITATDGNNCTGTYSVTIGQPAVALSATTTKVNVLCKGGATGTATVLATGGTTGYTYSWNTVPVQITATATGLIAGTYTVTVTDANGCTFSPAAVVITEPTLATSITASSTSPVCEASALNLISTPTSSTGSLTYAWSGPNTFTATTQNANIAVTTLTAAGTYMVKVTDGNNCTATATTAVVINPLPTIYTVSGTGVICSGVASPIILSGSTVGINYKLTAIGYGGSVLAGTGSALVFTPPSNILGVYTIEATNPITSCKVLMTGSVTTTNATNPTVTITAQTNVSCLGGNDGSVTAVASAGSGSYTYTFNGGTSQPTGVFSGKTAGTYPIVATDANTGCIGTVSAVITQPTSLPSATVASSGIACVGNTVTLTATATGGTGTTYMYNWNGTGFVSTPTLAVTSTSTNTLVVKDVNGCTSTAVSSTTVTFNTPTTPTISGSTTLCSGSTLSLSTSAVGTYVWSGPNAFTSASASISISNAQAINAGTYTVTVTDANSCVASATANVVINITPTVSVLPTTAILSCTTPSTVITASGATTYSWTGTGGFTAATAAATITAGGTYIVTGMTNGCTATASVSVTENKATPTITITPTTAVLTCLNPTTVITASGASTYSWTDNDGFTATTAAVTLNLAGTYVVTGTGTNGCTSTVSVIVTENKATPTINITNTGLVLNCTKPTTSLTASGGNSYSWSGPGGFTATTAIANIIAGGTYTVLATNVNGCTATSSVVVTEDKTTPTVSITPTTAIVLTCLNPTAGITASGSATSYSWSGTGGFTATTALATINAAGTYVVTGTGANGCTATANVIITEDKATPTINIINAVSTLNCTTPTTTIIANAGGSATYAWTGPSGFTATNALINVSVGGNYIVTATGVNGCTSTVSVVISEDKATPTVSITPTTAVVLTCGNPTASLTVTGGSTYSWTGPASFTTSTVEVSIAGTYVIAATGANGCTATSSIVVTEDKATPTVSITPTTAIVLTCGNPTASLTVTGGSTYSWTGPASFTTSTVEVSIAGTYVITATGANGCTATSSVVVTEDKATPTVSITPTTAIVLTCLNPTASLTATGGSTYSWTGPASFTTSTVEVSIAGTYVITATGANGCTATSSVVVTEDKATPTVSITPTTAIVLTCGNPTASLTATGGSTYSWSGPASFTTSTVEVSIAGTYVITATGANGCTSTVSVVISEDKATPTVSITPTTAVVLTCGNPTASLTATGGSTYSWSGPASFTTSTAEVSIAGTYVITATGANGCTATSSVVVTEDKATPTVSITPTTAVVLTCLTPSASITASGADTYSWTGTGGFTATTAIANISAGGTYTVTGTGANGCTSTVSVVITEDKATPTVSITPTSAIVLTCLTPSTAITASGADTYSWTGTGGFNATTAIANIIAGGTYVVTGMNANGCTATASVVIAEDKATPTVTVLPTSVVLTCLTSSATVTASGATSYSWTDNDGFTATTAAVTLNLAGTYVVIGTGANGCTATSSVIVTEDKVTPTISVLPTTAVLTCSTPSTAITASGASTYSWTGTGGFTATTAIATITAQGTYIVTGTGANGCTATSSVVITEDKTPPTVTVSSTTFILTCLTPSAAVTASGADSYSWTGTGGFTATTAIATITTSGSYTVVGTNINGCTTSARVAIGQNKTTPTVSITPTTAIVLTCLTPSTTITASGASTYLWSGTGGFTATTAVANITAGGTYVVTGMNANGCTATATVTITEDKAIPTITVTPTSTVLTCLTPSTAITASGASTYSWTGTGGFTATTAIANITAGGTYIVTATGANGCTATSSVVITEDKVAPTATVTGSGTLCSGSTISLTATGGGTYQWSGPNSFTATSAAVSITNATVSNSGTYIVTVTNANGCTASAMATITVNPVVAVPSTQAFANITSGGSITLTATGCSGTLLWFKSSDDSPVSMPVSPTTMTSYYAKCEVTTNGVTCTSAKSADVVVTVGVITSIKTGGVWEDPTTWDAGRVPLSTDEVIIDSNHNVIITTLNAVAKKLRYRNNGTVSFGNPATKLTISGL